MLRALKHLALLQQLLLLHGCLAPCPVVLTDKQAQITVQTATACSLSFIATFSDKNASSNTAGTVLAGLVVVQGQQNASLGRPQAVELLPTPQSPEEALLLPPGGILLLQDLLLLNVSLTNPSQGNPSNAFLPTSLQLPPGGLLKLRDVILSVRQDTLQAYVAFLRAVPDIVIVTDSTTFLHIRNYSSSPFAAVEARSLTLISPQAASINGTPIGVLARMSSGGSSSRSDSCRQAALQAAQQQQLDVADATAACGDAAGIVTVTDSYVLGATNTTMIPVMQQLASGDEDASRQPLLVIFASNVTLAAKAWGAAWPSGGVVVRRPLVWVGSSWRPTSVDFGMEVGQVVLSGQYANMTLMNLVLENLAYGDYQSLQEAEGNSIILSNRLWPFRYKRSDPRLVLHDVVLVIPQQQQIDNVIYWVNAFNSELDFWKNRTTFLRDSLKYTVIKYTLGRVPGEYIIMAAFSKDQLVWNVTYTTTPVVAPALPLPFDPKLHQSLQSGQIDPVIGSVKDVSDLLLTLWNQRSSACSRLHVLLPASELLSLAPTDLDRLQAAAPAVRNPSNALQPQQQQQQQERGAASSPAAPAVSLTPSPLSEAGFKAAGDGTTTVLLGPNNSYINTGSSTSSTGSTISGANSNPDRHLTWPPPGGELIQCPVQLKGVLQQQTKVDLGFQRDMFKVTGRNPQQQDAATVGAAAGAAASISAAGGVLQLQDLILMRLPQGVVASNNSNSNSSSGSGSGSGGGGGAAAYRPGIGGGRTNVAWVSTLPAQAYTHLLWFIQRDLIPAGGGGPSVVLTNVMLLLPPQEAHQLSEAAASTSLDEVTPSRTFTLTFPTALGALPVVYRNVGFPTAAAPSPQQPSSSSRRLLAGTGSSRTTPTLADSPESSSTSFAAALVDVIGQHSNSLGRFTARVLLQQQPASNPPASFPGGSSIRGGGVMCVDSLEGVGISGRNVCMVAQNPGDPLPPGFFWVDGSTDGIMSSSAGAGATWPPWKVAVVVLAVVIPVLAAAALGAWLCCRRGRQTDQHLSKSAAAAAADQWLGLGSTKDVKDVDVLNPSPNASSHRRIETGPACGAGSSSGSNSFSRLKVAAMIKLQDCCPGQSTDTCSTLEGSAASVPPLDAAAAADAARRGSSEQEIRRVRRSISRGSSEHGNPLTAVPQEGAFPAAPIIVELGEQLGRMAALHMASLEAQRDDEDSESPRDTCSGNRTIQGSGWTKFQPELGHLQQQQWVQAGSRATFISSSPLLEWQQQQQQQMPGAARISSAITSVTADIQMRRIGRMTGAVSSSSNKALSSTTTQGATAATGQLSSAAAAAVSSGKRGIRISIEEEREDENETPPGKQHLQHQAALPVQSGQQVRPEIQPVRGQAAAADSTRALSKVSGSRQHQQPQGQLASSLSRSSAQRGGSRSSAASGGRSGSTSSQLQLIEAIGAGSFGVVYRGLWRGIPAAVKVMQLPVSLEGALGPSGAAGLSPPRSPEQEGGLSAAATATAAASRRTRARISRREKMAVMEAALGSSLSHPNIVQVYTYLLRPVTETPRSTPHEQQQPGNTSSSSSSSGSKEQQLRAGSSGSAASAAAAPAVVGYELQLVMEYCPLGSLRAAIDGLMLEDRLTGRPHYLTVLALALGVARAMQHLHSEGIVHGDLKAGNVLLKAELQPVVPPAAPAPAASGPASAAVAGSAVEQLMLSGAGGAGRAQGAGGPGVLQYQEHLVAKVADFGLACRLMDQETHVSGVHRGTLTHMAPELLLHGRASRASDVYAFGILLWEMATGLRAFADVPKALLGAAVLRDRSRPEWPEEPSTACALAAAAAAAAGLSAADALIPPLAYRTLAAACWAHDPRDRPDFHSICTTLEQLLSLQHNNQLSAAPSLPPSLPPARQQQQPGPEQQQQQQQQQQEEASFQASGSFPTVPRSSLELAVLAAAQRRRSQEKQQRPSAASTSAAAPPASLKAAASVGVVGAAGASGAVVTRDAVPVARAVAPFSPFAALADASWQPSASGLSMAAAVGESTATVAAAAGPAGPGGGAEHVGK